MKFSDIEEKDWAGLQPYLDTCLLPLTALSGMEPPWRVTRELEKLRDVMDLVEKPYRGRVVTYPAIQYGVEGNIPASVNEVCGNLKRGGFRYVIVVTASDGFEHAGFDADLLLSPSTPDGWKERLEAIWRQEPCSEEGV